MLIDDIKLVSYKEEEDTTTYTEPLTTEITENTLMVVEPYSNLNNLIITRLEDSIDMSKVELYKIDEKFIDEIPTFVIKITDMFTIKVKESFLGELKIQLPLSELPKDTNLNYVNLYSLVTADGIDGEFWSPISIRDNISFSSSKPKIEITLAGLDMDSIFFIGIESYEDENNLNQKKRVERSLGNSPCTPKKEANGSYNYLKQNCTVTKGGRTINIKVKNFGNSKNSIRWNGTTIEDLIEWLVDAQKGFNSLNLKYDNDFEVYIHKMDKNSTLGYVTNRKGENRRKLHLTKLNQSKIFMQGTAVHEYFHHAQARTHKTNNLINKGSSKKWFIEGTARWFEDYLFDELNTYIGKEAGIGVNIFKVGLNSIGKLRDQRPYQRFSFFKLLKQKCSKFEDVFKNMLQVNTNDSSGIFSLESELYNASCNFGNSLDYSNSSSLATAMLYYQYATTLENDITLLDSNEINKTTGKKVNFNFQLAKNINKVDWNNIVTYISKKDELGINIIPKYGAYSFNLSLKDLQDINSSLFITAQTDNPLTIAGIHFDENDDSVENGGDNSFY